MQASVYSCKDLVAEYFSPPVVLANDATALRVFRKEVNKGSGQFSENPDDFHLYCVGKWDDSVGEMRGCDLRLVIQLGSLVESEAADE